MGRNTYFDNAKFLLIFFVVFGHLIQPLVSEMKTISLLYTWIYIFHMPAFIFLSGFFAKGSGEKGYIAKLTKKLLLPYFIFQLIYTAYYHFIGKEGWMATPFNPHWALWFLFSLFFWHLLLVIYKRIPAVAGVLLAVAIGLGVGYIEAFGHPFSLSRTFVFFPYFLLGFWLKKEHVFKLTAMPAKVISILFLSAVMLAIAVMPEFSTDWLLSADSYADLGAPVYGGVFRFSIYVVALLMSASILALVPKREGFFSKLGERTLYVYLLHGFFIQFFRQANLFHINHPIDTLGLAAIALGIVLLLSSKVIIGIWQPLIEVKISVMKRSWMQLREWLVVRFLTK